MAKCDMDCFHCVYPDCINDEDEKSLERKMKDVEVRKKAEYMKEYYRRNREKRIGYQKEYVKNHVEEFRIYQAKYYQENKERKKAQSRMNRMRKKNEQVS